MDQLAALRPDLTFTKVRRRVDFVREVRSGIHDVLWLANVGFPEELELSDLQALRSHVATPGPLGRGLLESGRSLGYAPQLGKVLGLKFFGFLLQGDPFLPRTVVVTGNHTVTEGFVGSNLSAIGRAPRSDLQGARPLAFFADPYPGQKTGKPAALREFPAITVANFGAGQGILIAPDVGTTVVSGVDPTTWTNVTLRSIDALLKGGGVTVPGLAVRADVVPAVVRSAGHNKSALVEAFLANVGTASLFDCTAELQVPEGLTPPVPQTAASVLPGNETPLHLRLAVPEELAGSFELTAVGRCVSGTGETVEASVLIVLKVEPPPGKGCAERGKGKGCKVLKGGEGRGGKPECPPGWLNSAVA